VAAEEKRLLRLRWDGACSVCSHSLARGTQAWWRASEKRIVCVSCASAGLDNGSVIPRPPDPGVAGASARREAERRRANREQSIRESHPRIGGLILGLSDEPRHIKAFDIGAKGEEMLGQRLDTFRDQGILCLHDRRRLRTKGNIDHVVVAPSGIYVVDAKRYEGRVHKELVGTIFKSSWKLYVGRRDCTQLAQKVRAQMADVAQVLAEAGFDLAVVPTLCFIDGDWSLLARPFTLDRVFVTWPKALYERLTRERLISRETACELATLLDRRFVPA
jgi:hypothetical protein